MPSFYDLPAAMTSADVLREFRAKHRLSQIDLALLVSRSRSTIQGYESGAGEPDGAVMGLVRLLKDVPTAEIVHRLAMARNSEPAELNAAEEAIQLSRFLMESAETKSVPIHRDDPNSDWRTERGAATRRFSLATLERVGQAAVPMAAGGALTGENTRQALGPLAIDSRLSRLGVNYVTADANQGDIHVAVMADPSCYWLREGEPMPEVAVTLANASSSYKTVATNLALSRRLLRQSGPSGMQAFARSITRALSREIDRGILLGNGREEPMGILAHDDLQRMDATTRAGTIPALLDAVAQLETNGVNSERIAVVASPKTKLALGLQQMPDNLMAWMQGSSIRSQPWQALLGFPALSLPSYDDGKILIGDFSQVTARVMSEVELRILDGLRDDGAHLVYAFLDVAIENPFATQAFIEITNVLVS